MLKNIHHIRYRRSLFSVNDYFLCEDARLDAGINYCIQCSSNINNALTEFYTLLIDLEQPLEKIRGEIYHRTVSEINSFLANQDFEHCILNNIGTKDLNHFIQLFDSFAGKKKIRKAERFRLKAYNREGILRLSYIKQNGRFICINFYRLTSQRAANLYSFTPLYTGGGEDPFNNSHLGRAHRTLHWLDILEFKKEGVHYYDFCGWYAGNSDKNLLNINKFKEQFTGNKVKEYSGVIYKNRLLLFLLKFVR